MALRSDLRRRAPCRTPRAMARRVDCTPRCRRHASWRCCDGRAFLVQPMLTDALGSARRLTRRQALLGAAGARALATGVPGSAPRPSPSRPASPLRPYGPTAPAGTPRAGGRLVVGTPREPDSLHPWLASTVAAFDILDGVMDGLLRYTAEGRLRPALAEGFSISDDGTDLHLRAAPGRALPQRRAVLRRGLRRRLGAFPGSRLRRAQHARMAEGGERRSPRRGDARRDHHRAVRSRSSRPSPPPTSARAPRWPRVSTAFREVFAGAPVGTGPFRVTGWEPGAGSRAGTLGRLLGRAGRSGAASTTASCRTWTRSWPRWRRARSTSLAGLGAIPPAARRRGDWRFRT